MKTHTALTVRSFVKTCQATPFNSRKGSTNCGVFIPLCDGWWLWGSHIQAECHAGVKGGGSYNHDGMPKITWKWEPWDAHIYRCAYLQLLAMILTIWYGTSTKLVHVLIPCALIGMN